MTNKKIKYRTFGSIKEGCQFILTPGSVQGDDSLSLKKFKGNIRFVKLRRNRTGFNAVQLNREDAGVIFIFSDNLKIVTC